ncbi:MAG: LapA family protein [Deltaproteobacteria bacterium]|nr:LapA family protein [Candidatus Anaeroferrophillacea bacterium]
MRYLKLGAIFTGLILLLVFIFENVHSLSTPVELGYNLPPFISFGPMKLPLYVLVFLALIGGAGAVVVLDLIMLLRQRRTLKQKNRRISELETELDKFRNLPLTETGSGGAAPVTGTTPAAADSPSPPPQS